MNAQPHIHVYPGRPHNLRRLQKVVASVTTILTVMQMSYVGVLFAPQAASAYDDTATGMSSQFDLSTQCTPSFGYGVVSGGIGTDGESDTSFALNVPGTTVEAFLFWNGSNSSPTEDTVTINSVTVTGQEYRELGSISNSPVSFVADLTGLGVVASGNHTYTVEDLEGAVTNGIALVVAYQDTTNVDATAHLLGGIDAAYFQKTAPFGPDSDVHGWTFPPSVIDRSATITVVVGDSDPTDPNRGDALWAETGTGALPSNLVDQPDATEVANNFMNGSSGDSLDIDTFTVNIPAGDSHLALQIESEYPNIYGTTGESLLWMATTLSLDEDCPAIDLTKTDREDPVMPGDTIVYDLAWSVPGNIPVTNLTLTDPIPDGTTFVSASNGGVYDSGSKNVTWSLGTKPVGANGTVTLSVSVDEPIDGGFTVENTATLDSTETPPVSDDETTDVIVDFQLDIAKSDSPDPVMAGDDLTYTIDWSVVGNEIAKDVTIVDTLDSRTAFVSASNGGTYDSTTHTVTWQIGDVAPPGDNGTVTLKVNVADDAGNGAVLSNVVDITSEEKTATDSEPTTVIADFYLTVDKTDSPDPVQAGSNLTYDIVWSVEGKMTAENLTLVDTLDSRVFWVSGGTYDTDTHTVSWSLGDQGPGASGVRTIVVRVPAPMANKTVLHNHVDLTSGKKTASDDEPTTVLSSSTLHVEKVDDVDTSVNPGDPIIYTIDWSVTGTDPVTDVTLTDTLPADVSFTSASDDGVYSTENETVVWELGDHVPGDSGSVTLTVTVDESIDTATDVLNVVTITSNETPSDSDNETTPVRVPAVAADEAAPILTIDKSVDMSFANPGDTVLYRVTVANTGNADAINTVLTDTLPAGLIHKVTNARQRSWKLGDLEPGDLQTVVYSVVILNSVSAGDYTNTATVSADNHDPISDMATIAVKIPQVLGFATTGARKTDVAVFAVGLLMVGAAGVSTMKLRSLNRSPLA